MRGRPSRFADFTGGWNPSAGPGGLGESEAADMFNVRPTVRGSLIGRAGDTELVAASAFGSSQALSLSRVAGLVGGELDALLMGTEDGKLYPYTNSGGLGASLGTFTPFSVWDFIDAPVSGGQGPVYGVNGTDAKYVTTAPAAGDWTAATGTFPAGAKYLAYVGNRVFAAGMSAYGAVADPASTLVFSEIGDPRNWPAANVVQFDPNDGEAIIALGEVGAGLLVFKRSKAWLVYDLDTGANRPLGVGVGCVSHRSIQQTPSGTIFLGPRNVWITDGTTTRSLSDNIEPHLVGNSTLPSATSAMDGQRYLVASSITILEYDLQLKSWWKHQFRGQTLAAARLTGEAEQLYLGSDAGLDRIFDSGHTLAGGSVPVPRIWLGAQFTLGSGRERVRGIEIEGSGTFSVGLPAGFHTDYTEVFADPSVRAEEAMGASTTVRRESDFNANYSIQPAFFAVNSATAMQIDAFTLYVTRRAG